VSRTASDEIRSGSNLASRQGDHFEQAQQGHFSRALKSKAGSKSFYRELVPRVEMIWERYLEEAEE
jgi:hypothetical protein